MTNKPTVEIRGRLIGEDYPPLVIAEIGINHEGSLKTACQMVDAAIAAGAEIIKHQTHVVEDEMSPQARNVIPGNASTSIYDIISRCSLSEAAELELKTYVEDQGAIFISTPFSRAAADRLERFDVPAYKIGSGECNNYPLIEHIASFGKPIILSTGMNDIASVGDAVSILERHAIPYCLLHCTNVYPTPDHLVRLGGLVELQQTFPNAVVGLSDHTIDELACLGATALGASVLERHFTDYKDRPGPDIRCSMDPTELRSLIEKSKRLAQMRGGTKQLIAEEKVTADFAYASVVAIRDIAAGDTFTTKNIWVKRPGTGDFLAKDFNTLLGHSALNEIKTGEQIRESDVAL